MVEKNDWFPSSVKKSPGEGDAFEKVNLQDRQKELNKYESLEAYHKERSPWVFDKKTGDLYEYDDFEEAFVKLRDREDVSASFDDPSVKS